MGLVIILVIVALPLAYMIWRFKKDDGESVAGGSAGHQILGGVHRHGDCAQRVADAHDPDMARSQRQMQEDRG